MASYYTDQEAKVYGLGTAAFPEFLSKRSGLPEKDQARLGPHADNQGT